MIDKRELGTRGPRVGCLGYGAMGLEGYFGASEDEQALVTIRRALDRGMTMIDTADAYGNGHNESLVARAIAGRRRDAFVATKFGIVRDGDRRGVRGDREYVRSSVEGSLRRLGTDVIDLYYLHRVPADTPIEETVGAMAELVTEGKVRFLGLSEAGASTLRRAHAVHPITALQSEWSLWSRDIEAEIVPTARELGIGLVPYSPLGRGVLTGRFTSAADFGEGDFRGVAQPRFTGSNLDANLKMVAELRALAEERGVTAGQLALAWVQHRGSDVVPIPGTKRIKYLEENVAAAALELSADDLAAIEAAVPASAVAGDRYPDMSSIGR